MSTWDSGSICDAALNIVDNVPASISGTCPIFVEKAAEKINNFNGTLIDVDGFDSKYMPTVLNFVLADVSRAMSIQGSDASEIKIGDFTKKSGKDSNVSTEAVNYDNLAKDCMNDLGRRVDVKKAFE